jgi:hypothetical protein
VAEVVEPYRAGLPAGVALSVDVPHDLPDFSVDRSLMGRALTNMIENALHAMPRGGALHFGGRLSADGRAIQLQIRDSGVGMDRAALARIFEPYFSTKAVGTGLGSPSPSETSSSMAERFGGEAPLDNGAGGDSGGRSRPAAGDVRPGRRVPVGGPCPDRAGQPTSRYRRERQQDDARVQLDDRDDQRHQRQHFVGAPLLRVDLLETAEADRATIRSAAPP